MPSSPREGETELPEFRVDQLSDIKEISHVKEARDSVREAIEAMEERDVQEVEKKIQALRRRLQAL